MWFDKVIAKIKRVQFVLPHSAYVHWRYCVPVLYDAERVLFAVAKFLVTDMRIPFLSATCEFVCVSVRPSVRHAQ